MKSVVRYLAYVVLLVMAVVFFNRFRAADRRDVARATARNIALVSDGNTNEAATALTNIGGLNPLTNRESVVATNLAELTNSQVVLKPQKKKAEISEDTHPSDRTTAITDLALFLGTLLVFGVLAAWDVAQYMGGRAGQAVMAENYLPPTDPDYEAAEAEWSKGNHMEALNLMRAYLQRNSNEQHVAIRIAEIYEKDLNNPLAAALELEEVLKKRLPREKWGWTAVRLANLYSGKLNQSDKALEVLHRIVQDYAETAAAKKARVRLGLPEEDIHAVGQPSPQRDEVKKPQSRSSPAPAPPPTPPPDENPALPKGFRARK